MSQIQKKFIGTDQVDDTKLLIRNNQPVRVRNAANSADINIFKVSSTDQSQLLVSVSSQNIEAVTIDTYDIGTLIPHRRVRATRFSGASNVVSVGDISSGTNTILNSTNPEQITALGHEVNNANFPANTLVTSVVGTTVTVSANATGTAVGATITYVGNPTFRGEDQTGTLNSAIATFRTGNVVDGISGGAAFRTGNATGTGSSGAANWVTGNALGGTTGSAIFRSGTVTTGSSGIWGAGSGNATGAAGVTGNTGLRSGTVTTGTSGQLNLNTGDSTTGTTGILNVKSGNSTSGGIVGEVVVGPGTTSVAANRGILNLLGYRVTVSEGSLNLWHQSSDPTTITAVSGDVYYNTTSNLLRFFNGTTWNDLSSGGGGANTALSNLASTAVNANINPGVDNTVAIGTSSLRYSNVAAVGIQTESVSSYTGDPLDLIADTSIFTFKGNAVTGVVSRLYDGAGANYMAFKAPDAVTTSTVLELPDGDGTANQVMKTNASGVLSWQDAVVFGRETFILSGTDITNQYVDLDEVALNNSVTFNVQGSPLLIEGALYDYDVNYTGGAGSKTRITFLDDYATGGPAALVAGDIIQISYAY